MSAPDPSAALAAGSLPPQIPEVVKEHRSDSKTEFESQSRAISEEAAVSVEEGSIFTPDKFHDEGRFETSRWELWSYYGYYIGNNGLSLFNFAPTQSQNLIGLAADPVTGLLPFLGAERTSNAIVLLANGISFAIQVFIFLILGSYADFGSWRPIILFIASIIAYGIGFGWLGVASADKWQIGVGLYMVGLIAYQTCITFWTAAFPGLARNTRQMRESSDKLASGEISRDEYDYQDSLMRSQISNIAFYVQSVAELFILAIIVGVLFGVHAQLGGQYNTWGLSVLIAFASGVWLLVSIPWFILEKRRPGIDPGMNIVLAGFWQLYRAMTQIWKLRQSLFYLIGYFLLGDTLNTSVTVIATLQNTATNFSGLTIIYLLIAGIAAQAVGIYAFWYIQRRFAISTKHMFSAVAFGIVLLDGWGMIGIWTQNFGFHHEWEFWLYQVFYGLFVCPWYSYSQIMISEVTPRGHEFLFFSLFSIMGKTSAFIGPIVSAAIITASPTNNNSAPFYFLFALSLVSFLFLLFFVDLKKSRKEQEKFLEEEAQAKAKVG